VTEGSVSIVRKYLHIPPSGRGGHLGRAPEMLVGLRTVLYNFETSSTR